MGWGLASSPSQAQACACNGLMLGLSGELVASVRDVVVDKAFAILFRQGVGCVGLAFFVHEAMPQLPHSDTDAIQTYPINNHRFCQRLPDLITAWLVYGGLRCRSIYQKRRSALARQWAAWLILCLVVGFGALGRPQVNGLIGCWRRRWAFGSRRDASQGVGARLGS